MEQTKNFHIADYIIFGATLVASITIGLVLAFCKRRDFSSVDYFFGGKKISFLPVALSFVVTFQSSLMILGVPAEVYGYGLKSALQTIGIMIAFISGAVITVPVFRPLQITSIYKYFNLRYGSNEVRFIAAAGGIIYLVFYMSVVVLGTCVALNSVLKVPFWVTVITYTAVTAIYTSLGGFMAVIWTDVFQLFIMLTGILATLIKSIANAGGPSAVYMLAEERFDVADFRLDPTVRYTVWICTFGPVTQFLVMFFTQAGLQRIKSTPDARSTYLVFVVSAPLFCIFGLLCFFEGVTIFAYYSSTGCDPLASGRISNINEVVPSAVVDLFGNMPGFPGLFIASLSSAALSTLSSCLTGLSSITFEDIIKIQFPSMSDKKATKWSKIVVFIYAALSMGLCFLMSLMPGAVSAIFQAFMGSIDGPTCGIFILSIFFRRSTTKGVIIGAVSGMIVAMTYNLVQTFISLPSQMYLPLGPTDRCTASVAINDTTVSSIANDKMLFSHQYLPESSSFIPITMSVTEMADTENDIYASNIKVLQKIFGISFALLSLMGFLVTIIIGVVASLLTKQRHIDKIDLMTLYPLPDRFCSLFPDGFFYSKKSKGESNELKEANMKLLSGHHKQTTSSNV